MYQSSFDLEGLPFLALIIGPYSQKNRVESLLNIFHLAGGGITGSNPKPFNLSYKTLPCTKLKKSFLGAELKTLLASYRDHKDLINLKARWSNAAGATSYSAIAQKQNGIDPQTLNNLGKTREDKLVSALELLLARNMKEGKRRQ